MKRFIAIFVILWVSILASDAQYYYGLSVKSYQVSSMRPTGLRSLKGSVTATIGNTADTRSLRNITATIYRKGQRFANGSCDNVTIHHGTQKYILQGRFSLADGVSTVDAILAAFSFHASDYTIDFSTTIIHPNGTKDHLVRTDIPLSMYLHR